MKRTAPSPEVQARLVFDLVTIKEFLRDLLFREAGQAYFKRLAVPRRRRWLSAWRTLSTYQAEQLLLPVGGRDLNQRIVHFFTLHACLRVEFHEGGMPLTAIRVLRLQSGALPTALVCVYHLECTVDDHGAYYLLLCGGPAPPGEQNA
jgi:hypothetical protein